jgi:hypothetical protein
MSRLEHDCFGSIEVGHTAHPTVYLNNLSFTNTFANIDMTEFTRFCSLLAICLFTMEF